MNEVTFDLKAIKTKAEIESRTEWLLSKCTTLEECERAIKIGQEVLEQHIVECFYSQGRILKHVRDNNLTHGDVEAWYESVGYKPRQAQKLIQLVARIDDEGINPYELRLSSPTKLYELLALPEGQIEPFIKSNDINNMTKMQIRAEVKTAAVGGNEKSAIEHQGDIEEVIEAAHNEPLQAERTNDIYERIIDTFCCADTVKGTIECLGDDIEENEALRAFKVLTQKGILVKDSCTGESTNYSLNLEPLYEKVKQK
ncbi:MAG: DUF3102 domain-containing protein [Ruminiclostridium sp.]|nr:DUF3102 domain-containing protein [Ruminiclostridium sp.]